MMAQVVVSVAYGTDTVLIDKLLGHAVGKIKETSSGILEHPTPDIRFIDFSNKGNGFPIEIPVVNFEMKEQIESKLRHAVSRILHENNVQLPSEIIGNKEF